MLFLGFVIILALFILYWVINADMSPILKFIIAASEMYLMGEFLSKKYRLEGEKGLILFKTKKGLKIINELAKNKKLWEDFADVGSVISYGLLSSKLFKTIKRRHLIAGIILITLMNVFVVPYAMLFLSTSIKGVESAKYMEPEVSIMMILGIVINYLFGFFGVLLFGILKYSFVILSALLSTFVEGTQQIQQTQPGVTPLIPGGNLPLFEGILALIVILIVHEGAHAILGRLARVPILSSGVVLFGIIPVGAFVEPDEEFLKRVERKKQTRVLVAGSASNFYTAIIFFFLFISFSHLTENFKLTGGLVISGMERGIVIQKINNLSVFDIKNISFSPGEDVYLETNKGIIKRRANEDGKLGIYMIKITKDSPLAKYNNPLLDFVFLFLGLTFSLNFIVGAVNLLPLPFFDGYRILEINVKRKEIVKALMYLIAIAFLINLLPWLFK